MTRSTVGQAIEALLKMIQNPFDTYLYYLTHWSEAVGLALTGDERLASHYYKISHHYASGSFSVQALVQNSEQLYNDYAHQTAMLSRLYPVDFTSIHITCIYDAYADQIVSYCRPLAGEPLQYEIMQQGNLSYCSAARNMQQAEQEEFQLWQTERLKHVYATLIATLGRPLTLQEIAYVERQQAQWLTKKVAIATIVANLLEGFRYFANDQLIDDTLRQLEILRANPLLYRRFLLREHQQQKEYSE